MPRKAILIFVMVSLLQIGFLVTFKITRAVDGWAQPGENSVIASRALNRLNGSEPSSTHLDKSIATLRITHLASNSDTEGFQLVPVRAVSAEKILAKEQAGPGKASTVVITLSTGKLFNWDGFPGVTSHAGNQGGYGYVKNQYAKSSIEARWYVQVPQSGYYDVFAYIPASPRATKYAVYYVFQNNKLSPNIPVNQLTHPDQWAALGSYYFAQEAGADQYVLLSNQTQEDTATTIILFSAVQLAFRP
jgi:hypothetical protein